MKPDFFEIAEASEYLLIPLTDTVVFPENPISIEINDDVNIKELERIQASGELALVVTKINDANENTRNKYYSAATTVFVQQLLRIPDGKHRALLIGESRAVLTDPVCQRKGYARAVRKHIIDEIDPIESKALIREAEALISEYMKYMPKESSYIRDELSKISDVGSYVDHAAANLLWHCEEKMKILREIDSRKRMDVFLVMLREMLDIFALQSKIRRDVKRRVDKSQKEYYLNEQMRAIRSELGEDVDSESECDAYLEKIKCLKASDEIKEKLTKEAVKLRKMQFSSVEYGVICNYLDICLDIPWDLRTKDRVDIKKARAILDRDHDGLEKVKERIIEYLAVKQLSPSLGNQILCLVGPPGTGKTSIASSIAEAMSRKYIRVSLGGVRDEADIRGHRKTYVGAMPGRIVNGLIKAGVSNPVMLLDEIDKMTRDSHGDPASAMMEVLDAEQNKTFRDHFVELDIDLSNVMFIATANSLDTIPRPLLDRMEVIELKSYSVQEKLGIAKHHLVPKQLKKHGISKKQLKITDGALKNIINGYTYEAGVRNLEREIASLCRKSAEKLINGEEYIEVTVKNLSELLGAEKVIAEKVSEDSEIGVVNGLAYTELGGSLLKVEVAAMPGSGKIELTGSLGDVMKESAKAAVTYIRSHATEFDIDARFYKDKDIHFHFPEGAVPKDGPSAGVTMVCALISELTGRAVKSTVAMTGEVTLRGKVLAIGGLKEKTMAAYKAGVKTVLIPEDNRKDLADIDSTVREKLEFIPCKAVGDVIRNALVN